MPVVDGDAVEVEGWLVAVTVADGGVVDGLGLGVSEGSDGLTDGVTKTDTLGVAVGDSVTDGVKEGLTLTDGDQVTLGLSLGSGLLGDDVTEGDELVPGVGSVDVLGVGVPVPVDGSFDGVGETVEGIEGVGVRVHDGSFVGVDGVGVCLGGAVDRDGEPDGFGVEGDEIAHEGDGVPCADAGSTDHTSQVTTAAITRASRIAITRARFGCGRHIS